MHEHLFYATCKKWGLSFVFGVSLVLGAGAWGQSIAMDLSTEASRQTVVEALRDQSEVRKSEAVAVAQARGWPVRGTTEEGRKFEISRLDALTGRPLYNITMNANAAISTAADHVRGTSPFGVDGSGLIVGIWDEGSVRSDHQEFVSPNRVIVKDGSSHDDHATHVGGTIGAKGVNAEAMGMAPAVTIHTYDWDDDTSEMVSEAATAAGQTNKINISNHSYGFITGWAWGAWSGTPGWYFYGTWSDREDRGFGQYGSLAVEYDSIAYAAPYYLPFKAAGNDRGEGPYLDIAVFRDNGSGWVAEGDYNPQTDPYRDGQQNGGYDTIEHWGNAKNIMTVGAVKDAVSLGARNLLSAEMTSFSGWGPSDDGRIKPDIVANGYTLTSAVNSSTTAYGSKGGTSMATPNAAGSALLLVESYRNLFPGGDMLASTLKGLIIHTADDIGNAGPDYRNGWGLMNTLSAAEHIQRHASSTGYSAIVESVLDAGTVSETYRFAWDGTNSIRATICWTDPPGTAQDGLNVATPALVNDLDIRLVGPGGTTSFPFVMDPTDFEALATTGDNTRDNVEQILVTEPAMGLYTLTVSHKGSLTNGEQVYSLLLSGSSNNGASDAPQEITLEPIPSEVEGLDYVVALEATASSGLPVTFAVTRGPGVIDGSRLTFSAYGTVQISASQAGDGMFAAAPTLHHDISVLGNAPFAFRAVALTDSVSLRWTDPLAAGVSNQAVMIRYDTNRFPQALGDGTELYSGTNTSFYYQHTNLVPRTTYYYSIWTSDDGETFVEPPR